MRLRALALAGLLLAPLPATAQVIAGTSLYFDHGTEDQQQVDRYQLCVATDCRDIGVTRVDDASLTFTVPAWVPRGRNDFTVRAVWKAPLTGHSAPTNSLPLIVVGGPERLRTSLLVTP